MRYGPRCDECMPIGIDYNICRSPTLIVKLLALAFAPYSLCLFTHVYFTCLTFSFISWLTQRVVNVEMLPLLGFLLLFIHLHDVDGAAMRRAENGRIRFQRLECPQAYGIKAQHRSGLMSPDRLPYQLSHQVIQLLPRLHPQSLSFHHQQQLLLSFLRTMKLVLQYLLRMYNIRHPRSLFRRPQSLLLQICQFRHRPNQFLYRLTTQPFRYLH